MAHREGDIGTQGCDIRPQLCQHAREAGFEGLHGEGGLQGFAQGLVRIALHADQDVVRTDVLGIGRVYGGPIEMRTGVPTEEGIGFRTGEDDVRTTGGVHLVDGTLVEVLLEEEAQGIPHEGPRTAHQRHAIGHGPGGRYVGKAHHDGG